MPMPPRPGRRPAPRPAGAAAADALADLIRSAERIFVLSGAGLSTESGISDFRGPEGLLTRNPAAASMFDIDAYRADRAVRVAAWRNRLDSEIRRAEPNSGHLALAAWQRARTVTIATQNIDGLHQRAGSTDVLELHGTFWQSVCLDCGQRGDIDAVFARVDGGQDDPGCEICGGILRTATVAFGQSLDPSIWRQAVRSAAESDLALAVGTSLGVLPAASLCGTALQHGAPLAVINGEPTGYDDSATLVINERIGAVLAAVDERLQADL